MSSQRRLSPSWDQIITKADQVIKFNQIILICTISMSKPYCTTQNKQGVHQVNILVGYCDMQLNLLQIFLPFDPIQGPRVCKRAEQLLAWCSMQHDFFQKRNQPFDLTLGAKSKCKTKLFAHMLLYASFL